jgi:hypothetical protein
MPNLPSLQKQALVLVFSNHNYIALSVAIFVSLFLFLSITSQFIFLQPNFLLYVPNDEILNFSLIVLIAALSGLVISLSIYRIRLLGESLKKSGTGFLGSMIGASAGACSCGPVGFVAVSAFGTVGGTATSFLTNYDLPLRLVSIGILVSAYYFSIKGISGQCKISR